MEHLAKRVRAQQGELLAAAMCMMLAAVLLAFFPPETAWAEEAPTFRFSLSVDGKAEKQAQPGDIVTAALHLKRTDSDAGYAMYAMQDEVVYDPAFLQLLPENTMTVDGVRTADVPASDGCRACYFSFVAFDGAANWAADTVVALFQFKVIGEAGASALCSRNFLVSREDGRERYDAVSADASVVVSDRCVVKFDTGGGSVLPPQTVRRGQTLSTPDTPLREGYRFTGWYADQALTRRWDFSAPVAVNMTLYAGWEAEAAAKGTSPWWALLILPPAALMALRIKKPKLK